MHECVMVLLVAFFLDAVFGDPEYALHPVRLIGRAIQLAERALRCALCRGVFGGALLVVSVVCISVFAYLGLRRVFAGVDYRLAIAFDIFAVYSCIALGDLLKHATKVSDSLKADDLPRARRAVQKMVGRDAESLDTHGVARAAVESVAEGFLDGVFSPLFWYVIGAVCAVLASAHPLPWAVVALLVYKTANTLDSMVGYRNERYLHFGRASARLDDAMNFPPARLAIPLLFAASTMCGLNSGTGWKTAMRDRLKHESPNSAHTESFAAGALGIRLGGPLLYPDGMVEKPWLGDGSPDATDHDVLAARGLVRCAGWISVLASAVLLWIMEGFARIAQ